MVDSPEEIYGMREKRSPVLDSELEPAPRDVGSQPGAGEKCREKGKWLG